MVERKRLVPAPPTPPTQAGDKYIVRFHEGMRDRIAEAAKSNNRSMNAEILARLESSFKQPNEPVATMSQLERVFKKMGEERKTAEFLQVSIRDLLATYVVNIYDSLPRDSEARKSFGVARGFAQSLRSEKAEDLEDWLAKAVPWKGSPEVFKGVASLLRYANVVREELKAEPRDPDGEQGAQPKVDPLAP